MPASVMASTCFIATTINKSLGVPVVVHTPPPPTTTAHPDYTIKNTNRDK